MESLKPIDQVLEGDVRHTYFGQYSVEVFHSQASAANLSEAVPHSIRNHFATAQNLLVYSWFFYPFQMTAQLHAYASVEFALRTRFDIPPKQGKFKDMLARAVKEGLVRDGGFDLYPVRLGQNYSIPNGEDVRVVSSYAEVLVEVIPKLRNELAHGSTMLFNGVGGTLRICADIINQLFEERPPGASVI